MKDCNDVDIRIGDRCVVVDRDEPYRGRMVWVRDMAVVPYGPGDIFFESRVRVDDAPDDDSSNWRWAAWIKPIQLAVLVRKDEEGVST